MKTKDFIKMLQDADPTGEGYIRLEDGIPWVAEPKEGYWDGPFAFIDDDGNYIQSTKGYKIDILGMDIADYVESQFDRQTLDNWDGIKGKIKSDTTYANKNQRDERHERLLKKAKEYFDQLVDIYNRIRSK